MPEEVFNSWINLNNFTYGSPKVTIVADATVPGGLGTFGYDDEGVPASKSFLID